MACRATRPLGRCKLGDNARISRRRRSRRRRSRRRSRRRGPLARPVNWHGNSLFYSSRNTEGEYRSCCSTSVATEDGRRLAINLKQSEITYIRSAGTQLWQRDISLTLRECPFDCQLSDKPCLKHGPCAETVCAKCLT
jgi:hypothetical protein